MLRFIFAIVILLSLSMGGFWLADHSGIMILEAFGYRIESTVTIAAMCMLLLCIVLLYFIRFLLAICEIPMRLRHFMAHRSQSAMLSALYEAMIAISHHDEKKAISAVKALHKYPEMPEGVKKLLHMDTVFLKNDMESMKKTLQNLYQCPDLKIPVLEALITLSQQEQQFETATRYCQELTQVQNSEWLVNRYIYNYLAMGKWQEMIDFMQMADVRAMLPTSSKLQLEMLAYYKIAFATFMENDLATNDRMANYMLNLANEVLDRGGDQWLPGILLVMEIYYALNRKEEAYQLMRTTLSKVPLHKSLTTAWLKFQKQFDDEQFRKYTMKLCGTNTENTESMLLKAKVAISHKDYDTAHEAMEVIPLWQRSTRFFILQAEYYLSAYGNAHDAMRFMDSAFAMHHDCEEISYYWDMDLMSLSTTAAPNAVLLVKIVD
jgi:uncharacterized membrane-anchored protein